MHAYNIFLAFLGVMAQTRKVNAFDCYDNNSGEFQKICMFRIIQAAIFFTVIKNKEVNLHKKFVELTQTNTCVNRQLEVTKDFKSDFLSCFSHEVRNPLNALHGSIDVLRRNIKEKSLDPILQGAKLSADVLLKLVNNILDASNIQADKFELNRSFYNLREIVNQLIHMTLESINQKKLTLQVYVDKHIPEEINTDASRLLQLMLNLLSNAVKFSEEGKLIQIYLTWQEYETSKTDLLELGKDNPFSRKLARKTSNSSAPSPLSPVSSTKSSASKFRLYERVGSEPSEVLETSSAEWTHKKSINTSKLDVPFKKVSINEINFSCEQIRNRYTVIDTNVGASLQNLEKSSVYRLNKPGYLKVEISDQGCGIAKQDQDRMFELFTRTDSSITRKHGGIGLGLWVTKQIIEKTGGEIKLYSEEGLGSTFVFYTPIYPPEDSIIHSRSMHEYPQRKKEFKLTALVVDDIKFNREFLQLLLEAEGIEVHTAGNGLEALNAYKNNNYDVIFTDLQMPEMDGLTSCREIRAIQKKEGRKEVDIYIVSGNCGDADVRECMDPIRGIGAKDFMTKPINVSALKTIVRRKVNRHSNTL